MGTFRGERMRARRKALHMTQDELAAIIGYQNKRNICNYEKGLRAPDNETLCKIADTLSCTTDYLLGREAAPDHEAASISDMTGLNGDTVCRILDICEKSGGDNITAANRALSALESIDVFFKFADVEEIGQRLVDWGNALSEVIEYVQSVHGVEFEAIKDSPEKIIEKWVDVDNIPASEYEERRRLQDLALGKRYALVKCVEELFLNVVEKFMVTNPATWEEQEER